LAFSIERGVPIIAHPSFQETTNNNIDVRRPASALKPDFPHIDFTDVEQDKIWPRKETIYAYSYEALIERGRPPERS
jgi:hypothetical protein